MVHRMKYILSLVVIGMVFVLSGSYVLAEGYPDPAGQQFSYEFHLFYDHGKITVNPAFKLPYDVIPEKFIQQSVSDSAYRGQIVTIRDNNGPSFLFDPNNFLHGASKGSFDVRAPYAANAKTIIFSDAAGKALLRVTVANSSSCNDNGTCDPDIENHQNCPNDCPVSEPQPATSLEPPIVPSSVVTPIPEAQAARTNLLAAIIYLVIGIILAIILIVIYRKLKARQRDIGQ